ncbi:MAG: hypothetical protein ACI9ZF_002605 [Bradyrhizobium sp.]|jgi:hypothetical protein
MPDILGDAPAYRPDFLLECSAFQQRCRNDAFSELAFQLGIISTRLLAGIKCCPPCFRQQFVLNTELEGAGTRVFDQHHGAMACRQEIGVTEKIDAQRKVHLFFRELRTILKSARKILSV